MYLLVISKGNGSVIYHGPFPTQERAQKYAFATEKDYGPLMRWHTVPLVIPYSVVTKVVWREA